MDKKNLNLVSSETFFKEYYVDFLYVPIKTFIGTIQIKNQDLINDFEFSNIIHYLQNFEIFFEIFQNEKDDLFFKDFYFFLIKYEFFYWFIDFLKLYFNEITFQVNENLFDVLFKQDNFLFSYELPYLPHFEIFKKTFLSSFFINFNSQYVIMKNFRTNKLFLYENMKNYFINYDNINIFVGNTLNITTFKGLKKNIFFISENFIEAIKKK